LAQVAAFCAWFQRVWRIRVRRPGAMVLVEEIESDDEVPAPVQEVEAPKPKADAVLKRGFLDTPAAEALYPPEGSPEGVVAPETHKAHTENKMNEDLNKKMNRGAEDNNGVEAPHWYTKEYPKGCQYNSPGCTLEELETSTHSCELKKSLTRGTRWEESTAKGLTAMRLSFMSINDEDIADLVEKLKGNKDITELDLSHNSIKDAGVQALVGALANKAAPNLKELRLYKNEFGDLGQTMLTQGLPVFRKKLKVQWQEPSYAHLLKTPGTADGYSAAAAPAAA